MNSAWLSVHIFGDDQIEVLRSIVDPIWQKLNSEGKARRFFYILYDDPSPHIRFRILPQDSYPYSLKDEIELLLNEAKLNPATKSGFSHFLWVDYIPEILRFGGADCLTLCETYFFQSSTLSLSLIKNTENFVSQRFITACWLSFLTAKAFELNDDQAVTFYYLQGSLWFNSISQHLTPTEKINLEEYFESEFASNRTNLIEFTGILNKKASVEFDEDEIEIERFFRFQSSFAKEFNKLLKNQKIIWADTLKQKSEFIGGLPANQVATYILWGDLLHLSLNRLGINNNEECLIYYMVFQAFCLLESEKN